MNLLYKKYICNVTHTRPVRYKQYLTGSCFDIELYSFLEYHIEDVKKLFVKCVDEYEQKQLGDK